MVYEDVDVQHDYEQASKYFAKAASLDNVEGRFNLARMIDRGLGVKKDHDMAQKLLDQVIAQPLQHPKMKSVRNIGATEAGHTFTLRYAKGIIVEPNLTTAAYFYQRAMDHGNIQSANNLALTYQDGNGVDMNLDKVKQLFELSTRKCDLNAMLNLALRLFYKPNFQVWYDRACEAGSTVAQAVRYT